MPPLPLSLWLFPSLHPSKYEGERCIYRELAVLWSYLSIWRPVCSSSKHGRNEPQGCEVLSAQQPLWCCCCGWGHQVTSGFSVPRKAQHVKCQSLGLSYREGTREARTARAMRAYSCWPNQEWAPANFPRDGSGARSHHTLYSQFFLKEIQWGQYSVRYQVLFIMTNRTIQSQFYVSSYPSIHPSIIDLCIYLTIDSFSV